MHVKITRWLVYLNIFILASYMQQLLKFAYIIFVLKKLECNALYENRLILD